MRNQPKYNFFKNTTYALNGLKDIIKYESSFKIELIICIFLIPLIFFIDIPLVEKLFLITTMVGVIIAETINSAIERVVDLVTLDHNVMAGRAKDVGSAIVFLSICLSVITWGIILVKNFG